MSTENFLRPVPSEYNLESFVAQNWAVIRRLINDGFPYQTYIDLIEKRFEQFERVRQESGLDSIFGPGFDWHGDYGRARSFHEVNLNWVEHGIQSRKSQIDSWDRYVSDIQENGSKLAQSGLGLIFAFHGAVVLGCMKILTEKTVASPVDLEARLGFAFGVIGLLLVGIGKLLLVQTLQKLAGRLRIKLSPNMQFAKLKAFPRYVRRYHHAFVVADVLIYGSLGLFIFYSVILTIMILSK